MSHSEIGLRQPRRRRGIERFEAILDVAETILSQNDPGDLTLAEVAEKGEFPLPSLYHFFANKNALLFALAGRHLKRLEVVGTAQLDPAPRSWQEYLARRTRNGANYLREHPDALRLFMGAGVSAEVRMMDLEGNLSIASRRAEEMRALFECAHLDRLEEWMGYTTALVDGIWSYSWSIDRTISPNAIDEAIGAATAYLRRYLPEHLPAKTSSPKRK